MSLDAKREKNYGVEALRILSMLMICVLHVLGQGGVLESATAGTTQHILAWLLEALAVCSVNCYALISGYVGVEADFKWSRLLRLWLEVVFYELLISLYFQIQIPDMMSKQRWLAAISPILSGEYWYISAYAGMFIFIPAMNAALSKLSSKRLAQIAVIAFILIVTLGTCMGENTFGFGNGFCMPWLCILYFAGGCLRRLPMLVNRWKWWLLPVFFISSLLTGLLYIQGEERFIYYSSPTVTLASLALTLFFVNTDFRGKALRRLIATIAPATLGVYLIHANPLIFEAFVKGFSAGYAKKSPGLMFVYVSVSALGLFFVCSAADLVRIKLFTLLRIDRLCGRIDKLLPDK